MHEPRPWWRRVDPADIRELITEANDGIIAVAGMALGLLGAEVPIATAYAVVTISTLAGALSIFGVKLGEAFANRESELATAEEERRQLELSPEEEIAEIAAWLESKGVSESTSRVAAKEMSAGDALGVQLELEYGIREVTSVRSAWTTAVLSGVAFMVGALVPMTITYFVPLAWRDEYTVAVTVIALALTSLVLAWLGRSKFVPTVIRTLTVGLGTLGLSFFLGEWLI